MTTFIILFDLLVDLADCNELQCQILRKREIVFVNFQIVTAAV